VAHAEDLRDVVRQLTDKIPTLVKGHPDLILPCLLDQLEMAREPSAGTTGTHSPYRSPVHLDVIALTDEMDSVTANGLRDSGYAGRLDLPRAYRLKYWAAHADRWVHQDHVYLDYAITTARSWVDRAKAILTPDPQTVETRAQPCPQCSYRTAMVWSDDHGERVQRSSLYLDITKQVVYCRVCAAHWAAPLWPLLCSILEQSAR
jgi:hypothetical protein